MRRFLLVLLIALLGSWAVHAQQGPPDYGIQNLQREYTSTEVQIRFDVVNSGGPASDTPDVMAILFTERGENIAEQLVPPLSAQESETITLSFPLDLFPSGSAQSLEIVLVGLEEVEAPIPETSSNNRSKIGVPIPSASGIIAETTPATGIVGINFDFSNPMTIGIAAGMVLASILLLVIVIAIFRLIFQRPPTFATWQPPYANAPFLDPNTTAGRRQGWQQHAQNDLPPPPPTGEGATHVRKRLIGLDGESLGNWHFTAMRLNQYDQYGRITRSQFIVPRGVTRRLNRLIKQAPTLDSDELAKRLRPLAGVLAHRFVKRIVPRSAVLPIAFDIHLQGSHGEVRILFDLFYVQGGQWRKIDTWEAEVAVVDKNIDENMTYTLYGLRGGEALKDFPDRLQADLIRILMDMIKHPDSQRMPTPSRTPRVPG